MHAPSKSWLIGIALAALALLPLFPIFSAFFLPADEIWSHILKTQLQQVTLNTAWLILGVGFGTFLLGTSLGWLTGICDFPGRKWLEWALILPLALPPYVIAFVMIGLLDYAGPLQTYFREELSMSMGWFPAIRSRGGIIFVLTLALYPYVYLLARNAFRTQGRNLLEAASSLGRNSWQAFFKVSLPMARPWLIAGTGLVCMETLADFGAVAVFNYDTFTTLIYKVWFSLFSLSAARQLASILILAVFVFLLIEQYQRQRMRYISGLPATKFISRIQLQGKSGIAAASLCLVVLGFAFLMPVSQLISWTLETWQVEFDIRYLGYLSRTFILAFLAAIFGAFFSLLLAYSARKNEGKRFKLLVRLATLGYAIPGTILAVGVFFSLTTLDKFFTSWLPMGSGQLISGTILAMLLAYHVRFLTVVHSPVESSLQRITPSIDESAQSLGVRGMRMFRNIHIPIIREGVWIGALLAFVEVMKEMPITLMTRPFGWDTLSVRIFELTSEGEWERAALPALTLVLLGLIPVRLLIKQKESLQGMQS